MVINGSKSEFYNLKNSSINKFPITLAPRFFQSQTFNGWPNGISQDSKKCALFAGLPA